MSHENPQVGHVCRIKHVIVFVVCRVDDRHVTIIEKITPEEACIKTLSFAQYKRELDILMRYGNAKVMLDKVAADGVLVRVFPSSAKKKTFTEEDSE